MRFQIDHDWQGNMSTTQARVGETAKTQLLLLLCLFWVFIGLIGHAPWKPIESHSISAVKNIIENRAIIAPLAYSQTTLETPPLYFLTAAASAQLFAPFLSMHDGARLANAFWIAIVLLMVGMSGRELWSKGVGRHATFIMIGTIGLVMTAHSLTPEIANLASCAAGFYALALSKRRPWRASGLLGLALSVGFLSHGILPLGILLGTALVLMIAFKPWRTTSFLKVVSTSLLIAALPITVWLSLLYANEPALFFSWIQKKSQLFNQFHGVYFGKMLIWYAWPALPLALWGLWRNRQQLLRKPKFQLMLVFFACAYVLISFIAEPKDLNALVLLLPLVALGAGSVEHLKRGAAAALNWFGISLFGIIGGLVWLGWIAMMTGHPAKIKERMQFLSATNEIPFQWFAFLIALFLTVIWLFTCVRAKQTNKSTVTNWAVGMTFGWGLLMTLWLPMLDSAKSYDKVFTSLKVATPSQYSCMNSLNVGKSQMLLLNYHTNIALKPLSGNQPLDCDLYLMQDERGVPKMQPNDEWRLIWQGKRAADRRESFRLFQRVSAI